MGHPQRQKHISIEGVDLEIEMPNARVVWLDTSVIIHWAMHRAGVRADPRYDDLAAVLQEGIAAGRLVVVAGEQEEEVTRDWQTFRSLLEGLSGKAEFKHKMEIEEQELLALMRAWDRGGTATIRRSRVFSREVLRPERGDFLISVVWGDEERRRHDALERRKSTATTIDDRRQICRESGVSFEQARRDEVLGHLRAMAKLTARGIAGLMSPGPGPDAIIEAQALGRLFHVLQVATGQDDVPATRLTDFFVSNHALAVPSFRVRSTLWAHMMLDTATIVRGDLADIDHLKVAIPYSDVVVADRRMVSKVKHRSLDREFHTSVFAMRDFDALVQELRDLGLP